MKLFKDWTIFEIVFLIIGTLVALILTPLFNGTVFDLGYTLLYFWTALLLAKGKYSCYIIGIISTFFYAYVSYTNRYYGEVIISMSCTLPLMIVGLINWIKHQDNSNTEIKSALSLKETGSSLKRFVSSLNFSYLCIVITMTSVRNNFSINITSFIVWSILLIIKSI